MIGSIDHRNVASSALLLELCIARELMHHLIVSLLMITNAFIYCRVSI